MYVSVKPLIDVVRFLEKRGIDQSAILSGDRPENSISVGELSDPSGTIPWSKFAAAANRAGKYLTTNEDLAKLVLYILSDSSAVLSTIKNLIRSAFSTAFLYHMTVNLALRRFISAAEATIDTKSPQYRMTVRLPEDGPPCEIFLRVLKYILEFVPAQIGLSHSVVTAEISGHSASYLITPPPMGGLFSSVWRKFRALFFTRSLLQQIVELEISVQRKHDALAREKSTLERNLDQRTVEIQNINRTLNRKISQLAEIEELSGTGTWTINTKTKGVSLSENAAKIIGIHAHPGEITHDQFVSTIHPDDRKEYRIALARLNAENPEFYIEHRVVRNDVVRIIQQKGKLVSDGTEKTIIGSILDLTSIRANELRLIEEREAALEASRNKSQFLAGMSHEIRTPMTSVLGFAELIINPKTPAEKTHSYVETILRNGRHLLVLIDDILDLSKVEAGHLRFNTARHATTELILNALENIRSQADKKSVAIDLSFADGIPEELITDATRFGQIINNVLGNAIKFTDEGTIKVFVSAVAPQGDQPGISIIVEDEGKGISQEFSRLLFSPYSVFDMEKKRGKPGTGLGLALARALAKAMGGDIKLLSNIEEVGCRFEIVLRSMPANAEDLITPAENYSIPINMLGEGPLLKNKHILIVEDNRDIQEILAKTIHDAGATIELASNGIECLKKTEQTKFDVILMDLQMPVMDGFETTERLRAGGFKRPIIVVTAYALNNERERCLKAGATDFVTKPINSDLLLKTLVRHRN